MIIHAIIFGIKYNINFRKSSFTAWIQFSGTEVHRCVGVSSLPHNVREASFKKKLYGPLFLWMGFNCLKATATSRRQFTFYQSSQKFLVLILSTSEG